MPLERRRAARTERRAPANKWALAVAIGVALAFLYVVRLAVVPFLAAAAIAYVAGPAVRWLARAWHLPRAAAAAVVFVGIMALFGGLTYWSIAALEGEVAQALGDLPQLLHKFLVEAFGGEDFALFGKHYEAGNLASQMAAVALGGLAQPQAWLEAAFFGVAGIGALILIVILIFYFLAAGPELAAGALWLVPPEYRDEVAEIAAEIDPMLRRYLLGLLGIVIAGAALAWPAIALVLHLPFALLLSLLTGVLELLPVIGPAASAGIVGLLSLEQHGLWPVIAFALYVTVYRVVIDRLIGPIILGQAVSLHPVVVIFAFLAGGMFLGIAGVVLAVPVAATVKIVLQHYYSQPTHGERS
jgi:predicted PurR-regulated permease PerM